MALHPHASAFLDLAKAVRIREVLEGHKVSLTSAALQFPLRHPAVTSVLTGPRTAAELLENVDAFNLELPADIWAELEGANLIERIPA